MEPIPQLQEASELGTNTRGHSNHTSSTDETSVFWSSLPEERKGNVPLSCMQKGTWPRCQHRTPELRLEITVAFDIPRCQHRTPELRLEITVAFDIPWCQHCTPELRLEITVAFDFPVSCPVYFSILESN